MNELTIQISLNGEWQDIATVELLGNEEQGVQAKTRLIYIVDYVHDHINKKDIEALSINFPVDYTTHYIDHWPPFLVDIMPAGAHRRYWVQRLNIPSGASSDWTILSQCVMNPPGNLRIKEAAKNLSPLPYTEDQIVLSSVGFDKDKVVSRDQEFIKFMESTGAPVGGASGAHGDAPKFLMSEGIDGKFYPSGLLDPQQIKAEWLIKYAKTADPISSQILMTEAQYMQIAKNLNCNVYSLLTYERGCLFIPRFDLIIKNNQLIRHGLESMASATKYCDFSPIAKHEEIIDAIYTHSSKPEEDINEWIKRDILNVCLGNTDNHLFNSAFIKSLDGNIRLSPLYDFAPMMFDTEGIIRKTRWDVHEVANIPKWHPIVKRYCNDNQAMHKMIDETLSGIDEQIKLISHQPFRERIEDLAQKVKIQNG